MSGESLEKVFYVSSKGEIYAPIARDHALVAELSHTTKPGFYTLTILDNPDVSPYHRARVLKHFLAKSVLESFTMSYAMEKRGQVTLGPFTHEAAETKAGQIGWDGREQGYRFEMVLEKA